ncbi:transcription repressor OFP6-like [Salvia divinorum]|uniref:Transcription repressor n=1 Tax=Salvia divinorum TaxID=28513 RepID=A0ABD1GRC1_SALDI
MTTGRKRCTLSSIRVSLGCSSCSRQKVFQPKPLRYKSVQGLGRVGGSSVAVEKESDDPYLDFRQSMLQMILEKEIYSKDDLKQLLNCFLQLNSSYYHGIIVRAFTDIWNALSPAPHY